MNANAKPDMSPIDFVLGQPNPTTCNPGTTQSTLNLPTGVTLNPFGTLYVSDANNNRVMAWMNGALLSDGSPANYQIGQPDFNNGVLLLFS